MGRPLLQSVISVLRETWDFEFVLVTRLVAHRAMAVLVVISCGSPSVRFRSQLFDRYTRFAEVLHHLRELHECQGGGFLVLQMTFDSSSSGAHCHGLIFH